MRPCAVIALACAAAVGCTRAQAAAPSSATETCTTCHGELPGKLREPVRLLQGDVHLAAGVTCSGCHGGDPKAQRALSAHGTKEFVASPATSDAMANMCGRCHKAPAENYLKGPHQMAQTARRRPDCTTCHGAHGISKASVQLIAEPLCSSCHTVERARRIYKALTDPEREIDALDAQLRKVNNPDARAKLREARTQLRGLTHALDLFTITRNAATALETVDTLRAKALPHAGAADWGRRLRIAGLVLAGFVFLIGAAWGFRALWARRHKLPLPRSKELTLLASVAGVLAIAALVAGYKGMHYIEHDPKFCTSCHTMGSAYALWEQSGHKQIECHTCHTPDIGSNLHQLWYYATRRPDEVVKHADVDHAICERCHTQGGNASKWNHVQDTPGHRVHVGKERVECIQCHSMSLHRFKPPKETCATCHKKITLTAAGTMGEMHCLSCHPFMADDAKRPLKPDRAACLDCHEKRQVGSEVFPAGKAPMKWDCGRCHKPHERLNIGNADCVKCHDSITEGLHKVRAHADDCKSCHKPHGWTSGSTTCLECHRGIQPARHHPGKGCTDCHGAWDDAWVKLARN